MVAIVVDVAVIGRLTHTAGKSILNDQRLNNQKQNRIPLS